MTREVNPELQERLSKIVKTGTDQQLRDLLNNPNAYVSSELIMLSMERGHKKIENMLTEHASKDLDEAIADGNVEMVQDYLNLGVFPSETAVSTVRGDDMRMAIDKFYGAVFINGINDAVRNRNLEALQDLVGKNSAGYNRVINSQDPAINPLIAAVKTGNAELVRYLHDHFTEDFFRLARKKLSLFRQALSEAKEQENDELAKFLSDVMDVQVFIGDIRSKSIGVIEIFFDSKAEEERADIVRFINNNHFYRQEILEAAFYSGQLGKLIYLEEKLGKRFSEEELNDVSSGTGYFIIATFTQSGERGWCDMAVYLKDRGVDCLEQVISKGIYLHEVFDVGVIGDLIKNVKADVNQKVINFTLGSLTTITEKLLADRRNNALLGMDRPIPLAVEGEYEEDGEYIASPEEIQRRAERIKKVMSIIVTQSALSQLNDGNDWSVLTRKGGELSKIDRDTIDILDVRSVVALAMLGGEVGYRILSLYNSLNPGREINLGAVGIHDLGYRDKQDNIVLFRDMLEAIDSARHDADVAKEDQQRTDDEVLISMVNSKDYRQRKMEPITNVKKMYKILRDVRASGVTNDEKRERLRAVLGKIDLRKEMLDPIKLLCGKNRELFEMVMGYYKEPQSSTPHTLEPSEREVVTAKSNENDKVLYDQILDLITKEIFTEQDCSELQAILRVGVFIEESWLKSLQFCVGGNEFYHREAIRLITERYESQSSQVESLPLAEEKKQEVYYDADENKRRYGIIIKCMSEESFSFEDLEEVKRVLDLGVVIEKSWFNSLESYIGDRGFWACELALKLITEQYKSQSFSRSESPSSPSTPPSPPVLSSTTPPPLTLPSVPTVSRLLEEEIANQIDELLSTALGSEKERDAISNLISSAGGNASEREIKELRSRLASLREELARSDQSKRDQIRKNIESIKKSITSHVLECPQRKSNEERIRSLLSELREQENAVSKAQKVKTFLKACAEESSTVGYMMVDFPNHQHDASEFTGTVLDILYQGQSPLVQIETTSSSDERFVEEFISDGKRCRERLVTGMVPIELTGDDFQSCVESAGNWEKLSQDAQVRFDPNLEGEKTTDAERKISFALTSGAKEVVFSLKRFAFDKSRERTVKNDKKVALDNISLPIQDSKDGEMVNLVPTAVICHDGHTSNSGHYISYVREVDDSGRARWFLYNDAVKQVIDDERLLFSRGTPYVVKYSAVDSQGYAELPRTSLQRSGATNQLFACWANSSAAFIGSFTSFVREHDRQHVTNVRMMEPSIEQEDEKSAADGDENQIGTIQRLLRTVGEIKREEMNGSVDGVRKIINIIITQSALSQLNGGDDWRMLMQEIEGLVDMDLDGEIIDLLDASSVVALGMLGGEVGQYMLNLYNLKNPKNSINLEAGGISAMSDEEKITLFGKMMEIMKSPEKATTFPPSEKTGYDGVLVLMVNFEEIRNNFIKKFDEVTAQTPSTSQVGAEVNDRRAEDSGLDSRHHDQQFPPAKPKSSSLKKEKGSSKERGPKKQVVFVKEPEIHIIESGSTQNRFPYRSVFYPTRSVEEVTVPRKSPRGLLPIIREMKQPYADREVLQQMFDDTIANNPDAVNYESSGHSKVRISPLGVAVSEADSDFLLVSIIKPLIRSGADVNVFSSFRGQGYPRLGIISYLRSVKEELSEDQIILEEESLEGQEIKSRTPEEISNQVNKIKEAISAIVTQSALSQLNSGNDWRILTEKKSMTETSGQLDDIDVELLDVSSVVALGMLGGEVGQSILERYNSQNPPFNQIDLDSGGISEMSNEEKVTLFRKMMQIMESPEKVVNIEVSHRQKAVYDILLLTMVKNADSRNRRIKKFDEATAQTPSASPIDPRGVDPRGVEDRSGGR